MIFITLPDDLDCGTILSDTALSWCHDPSWQIHMGPTSAALYSDAVTARR